MNEFPPRPIAATLVLLGCTGVLAAHLATLYTSGQDPLSTPVAALSHSVDGDLNGLGLSLFAVAQIALAALLRHPEAGWPTRVAQVLLAVDAALIVYVAWRFEGAAGSVPHPPRPGEPLSLLASGTGLVMGFAAPGLLRRHRAAGRWNLACLLLWLALVPLALLVGTGWVGAYERLVGAVFLVWAAGLAGLLGFADPAPSRAERGTRPHAEPRPEATTRRQIRDRRAG